MFVIATILEQHAAKVRDTVRAGPRLAALMMTAGVHPLGEDHLARTAAWIRLPL